MNKKIEAKLKKLPASPGVYFHKNNGGEIIYIGKAANLRNRVRQYFQSSRYRDPKTDLLVEEIADVDWTEVETEIDALFLEAEMVRRYMPPYNILLRDDKSSAYIRIDYKSDYPTVTYVRRPLDDGAKYFGPYLSLFEVKKALRYLRRAFPYAISKPVNQKRASLHYHLGLDPGLEDGRTTLADYRANLRKLMKYLRGERVALVREIERDMKRAAKAKDFELAARLRNQLYALQALSRKVIFSDREMVDASKDQALVELTQLFKLSKVPKRIEGFDISHLQGSDNTSSMVVFVAGLPYKTDYRKFKLRVSGNDDFAHMAETISRRFSEVNRQKWGTPDLVLIDGGRGQLSAALETFSQKNLPGIRFLGLAKRHEEIIIRKSDQLDSDAMLKLGGVAKSSGKYINLLLPESSHVVKLLARIRDESHRFAVSYHSSLRAKRQTASMLDEIPGIGPATRKKLIRHFGSVRALFNATEAELKVAIGNQKGQQLAKYLTQAKTDKIY